MSFVASFFTRMVCPNVPASIARATVFTRTLPLAIVIVTNCPGRASGTASTMRLVNTVPGFMSRAAWLPTTCARVSSGSSGTTSTSARRSATSTLRMTCFVEIGRVSTAWSCHARATAWTVLAALVAGGGHWVCMGMCCYMPLELMLRGPGRDFRWLPMFEAGLTPPVAFAWAPFREWDELDWGRDGEFPTFMAAGLVAWAVAAAVAWGRAHERFRRLTHRGAWVRGREVKG